MTENEIYDYLQVEMPKGLQFVNPYIDDAPVPKGDFATMNIISIQDKGRSTQKQKDFNDYMVNIEFEILRVYTIQFDFFGINSFDNSRIFKQTLEVNLSRKSHQGKNKMGLLRTGLIRNLTNLLTEKKYLRRYSFDADFSVVDTIEQERNYLTGVDITLYKYN